MYKSLNHKSEHGSKLSEAHKSFHMPTTTNLDLKQTPLWAQGRKLQRQNLQVNTPGDMYEEEADAVASQVMRMPTLGLQRRCACGGESGADGECAACQAKQLQRSSEDDSGGGQAPPSVHQTLKQSGSPLDHSTRAFMEPRFGRDFGDVRVHTDSQASQSADEVDAHAYTAGQHIVFKNYQPTTMMGQAILAHELTHTIQQRGTKSTATEQSGLEDAADNAAVNISMNQDVHVSPAAATPAIQFLKVTRGGFGRALEEYTNINNTPNNLIRLLRQSRTFMQMARILDRHYIWYTDSYNWERTHEILQYDAQHRITNEPARIRGKRELAFTRGSGSSFEPFNAPSNNLSSDIITLKSSHNADFLRSIAHEAAHARNHVGQSGPSPATLVASVTAGIQEEINVRTTEQQVVGQIRRGAGRLGITFGAAPTTVPAEVERDLSPGIGLTYLENIFFNWRLHETQTSEGLSDDEASDIRAKVNRSMPSPPLIFGKRPNPTSGLFELSQYAEAYFNYKTAQREWIEFRRRTPPGSLGFSILEDNMRQDHARRFFGGRVAYSPLPTPAASTAPSP